MPLRKGGHDAVRHGGIAIAGAARDEGDGIRGRIQPATRIGRFDPVNAGRRLVASAREQPGDVQHDMHDMTIRL